MSLNKAMIIGRIGRDPEMRYTKAGTEVCNFSVATSETFTPKGGQKQEKTEWHNIVAWGKVGKFCGEYLKKGREVYVEGSIQTRDWTDKDNVKHYKTEINAQQVRFVGPKPADAIGPTGQEQGGQQGEMPPDDDLNF